MGISSLGIGSGIDTAGMLEKLQASEQTRLRPFTSQQTSYKSKISAWGQISSLMSSLQKSAKTLGGDAFNTLSVSANKAFTATASSSAIADSHDVTVVRMASAHKLKTGAQDSADSLLGKQGAGTRTLTITQHDGKEVKVELSDDETSLNQIAKAINKQKGDVNASVQRTDDGYQLVLSSTTTGTDGEMSVHVDGDDTLGGILNTTAGGQHLDASGHPVDDAGKNDSMIVVADAQDAKLKIDGSDYTRPSNNITDILDGVTLKLNAVSDTDDNGALVSEQLTLTPDNSAIKDSLKDFVKQYNALLTTTSAASKYVQNDTSGLSDDDVAQKSDQSGPLTGDSTLRGLVGEMRSAVNGVYGDTRSDYSSLADLGITIDAASGQMTLNEDKLDEAVADDADKIAVMFTGSGSSEGLSSTLDSIITRYTGDDKNSKDGIIKMATKSLDDQGEIIQQQIDKTQKQIDSEVERYRKQFEALDTSVSKMNNMSSQVTSLLSSL